MKLKNPCLGRVSCLLFPFALLFGLLCYESLPWWYGREIVVMADLGYRRSGFPKKTVSIFYSYNSVLKRDIGTFNRKPGKEVFAILVPEGRVWKLDRITEERPADGIVYLRGRVGGNRGILFGIENFYPPEGSSEYFWRRAGSQVEVTLLVTPWGRAKVKELRFVPPVPATQKPTQQENLL